MTAALWSFNTAERLMTFVSFRNGWLSFDKKGRYISGGNGLGYLTLYDPNENSACPTLWEAEDLPHLARLNS